MQIQNEIGLKTLLNFIWKSVGSKSPESGVCKQCISYILVICYVLNSFYRDEIMRGTLDIKCKILLPIYKCGSRSQFLWLSMFYALAHPKENFGPIENSHLIQLWMFDNHINYNCNAFNFMISVDEKSKLWFIIILYAPGTFLQLLNVVNFEYKCVFCPKWAYKVTIYIVYGCGVKWIFETPSISFRISFIGGHKTKTNRKIIKLLRGKL